jgi:hypothetical protein
MTLSYAVEWRGEVSKGEVHAQQESRFNQSVFERELIRNAFC